MNENGDPLHFGILSYSNTMTSTFHAGVKPQDVKAALVMLTYLFLEHHTVEDVMLFDSSLLLIKASSKTQLHVCLVCCLFLGDISSV